VDIGQSTCPVGNESQPFTIDSWRPAHDAGSKFVAKLVSRKGKRLPRAARLRNKVAELFYSLHERERRTKVRTWFVDKFHLPRYWFRISGRSMSDKQKICSMIFRMVNVLTFNRPGTICPARAVRHFSDQGFGRILPLLGGRFWYAPCQMAYRRLKVLLSP